MSILINKSVTFPVEIAIGVTTDTPPKVLCTLKENEEARKSWPEAFSVAEHKFTLRQLDFLANSRVVDKSVEMVGGGLVRINGAILRFHKLLASLVSWTLTDDNNKPIPINAETVGSLPPEVAQVVCDEIDRLQTGF